MSSLVVRLLLVLPGVVLMAGCVLQGAQEREELTIQDLYSVEVRRITSRPSFAWLDDGRLVLYDSWKPKAERTLEVLNPATGERAPLVEGTEVLEELNDLLGEEKERESVPFPREIHGSGKRALYVLDGDIFTLDIPESRFVRVTGTDEEEKSVRFSPHGSKIAFTRDDNLFVHDITTGRTTPLTSDTSATVLNGNLSWIYWEEIFGRHNVGYWWSGDSRQLAFLQTEESSVSIQHYVDVTPWTPTVTTQRYPKLGEELPRVRVGIVDVESGQTRWVDFGSNSFAYIVRVHWLPDNRGLAVQTMNRLQTELDLFFADVQTGTVRHILNERSDSWVNILEDAYVLQDGKHLVWPSERDGYLHLYRYGTDGTLLNQITLGDWTLCPIPGRTPWYKESVAHIDEGEGWLYFCARQKSPLQRHLYRVRLDGTELERISVEPGSHGVTFSPDGRFYVDRYSSLQTPPSFRVHSSNGQLLQVLAPARHDLVQKLGLELPALLQIPARDDFPLPAMIMKPADFDPKKKYPVIVHVYGGPSRPQVVDEWQRGTVWYNILLQNGYIVLKVDNRGGTGISKTLESGVLHRIMGEGELNDLVDAVLWMKSQPYVDPDRIGLTGSSSGGTYTILGMTRSKEFKAGIASAGLIDVRYYDAYWSERFMKTEKENPEGFEEVSLLNYAGDLHGRLLIIHGTHDDNVHIQNTWAFVQKLVQANKLFDLMIYPMQKHGVRTRRHFMATQLDFWKRNL
jgi:dipeptidyl-peptidase-4